MHHVFHRRYQHSEWQDFINEIYKELDLGGSTNAYRTLELDDGASYKEVKASYKRLARKWHPDRPTGNHEKFIEIRDAYEKLTKLHQYKQSSRKKSSKNKDRRPRWHDEV